MKTTRVYNQTARAAAAEETRLRILRSAFDLQAEYLAAEVSLDAIAERAGVSVQTILRRFGSKAALLEQTIAWINAEIAEERRTPSGDVPLAIRVLLDHYDKHGDFALLLLAQEASYDHVRQLSDAGKNMHRGWVADVFAPYLNDHDAGRREELIDLLVVATDVYTWKLLRRDRGLSRKETENRIKTLIAALLPETGKEPT